MRRPSESPPEASHAASRGTAAVGMVPSQLAGAAGVRRVSPDAPDSGSGVSMNGHFKYLSNNEIYNNTGIKREVDEN